MRLVSTIISVAALAVAISPTAFGQVYTSLVTGATVNANIYTDKGAVYLSAGPLGCNQNGLAPGDYYFQVTTPNGTLLSNDALDPVSNRKITVQSGSKFGTIYTGTHGSAVISTGCVSPNDSKVLVQAMPYDDTTNNGGEYKVWLYGPNCQVVSDVPGMLLETALSAGCPSKTDNFKVDICSVNCGGGDDPTSSLSGVKYYDANANGVKEEGEVLIPNWRVDYTISSATSSTFTNASGQWGIVVASGSNVLACEVMPATGSYIQTGPLVGATSGLLATANGQRCWVVTAASGDITNLDFGNVCLGAGGGLTLGFWSNRNGQALVGADDLAMLSNLNLRNANGSEFNPTGYSAFRTWILNATATNMAYMLSAQLAAMELNVYNGKVSGGSLIYAPGTTSANQAGFATVNAIMAEANASLGTEAVTTSGHPQRSYQEALKNALDKANNNLNFVQASPCAFTY